MPCEKHHKDVTRSFNEMNGKRTMHRIQRKGNRDFLRSPGSQCMGRYGVGVDSFSGAALPSLVCYIAH